MGGGQIPGDRRIHGGVWDGFRDRVVRSRTPQQHIFLMLSFCFDIFREDNTPICSFQHTRAFSNLVESLLHVYACS